MTWWDREVRAALRSGISRERWLDLTPREFFEELDAFRWREKRMDARVVMGAWFTEYYARAKVMPKLREHIEELFGEGQKSAEEKAEETSAAARAWNRQFAAIWKAQEAAKAAGA